MNAQASSQCRFPSADDGLFAPPNSDGQTGHVSPPRQETSQAERAAMHPEPHDLEWGYYFGAWSH